MQVRVLSQGFFNENFKGSEVDLTISGEDRLTVSQYMDWGKYGTITITTTLTKQ